jgi:hypothetical protein
VWVINFTTKNPKVGYEYPSASGVNVVINSHPRKSLTLISKC